MKTTKVKELMVPLANYAVVKEDATLFDAIVALKETQIKFDRQRYPHRAVLVIDETERVVGKVSQLDVLKALEPNYDKILKDLSLSQSGLSIESLKSMVAEYALWQKPLDDICRKAATLKVKDIMYTPSEGEYVNIEDSLDQAIHQLVMGHHQSLLVVEGNSIVGILRLTDVFMHICNLIESCKLESEL
ncbi:MAG: CBS domain-containing protein [Candidatus Desulfofervidus auxilii]|nr:CBS domain-containing protein [Candidatus Desulfofervidus auxilii]